MERVADALRSTIPSESSLLLGLSGGLDSVVLLHLLSRLAPQNTWKLSALYVHHGLSPHADEWAQFCADYCAELGVPFQTEYVDIAPLRHLGIEAAARQLRHAALNRQPADFVALAHHQDDQAETLVLQLLRGAGVRGAAAMPMRKLRPGLPTLIRPLLNISRAELQAYAAQQKLRWVDDESNADVVYSRNFLRHSVLPLLEKRFPAYRATLSRSAEHFAEASLLLDELAAEDARAAIDDGQLNLACLHLLSFARAKNLLRYFLRSQGAPLPDASRLQEMYQQLINAQVGAKVQVEWQGWQLRRYRQFAYVLHGEFFDADWECEWRGESVMILPDGLGELHFQNVNGRGLSAQKIKLDKVLIRNRRNGELGPLNASGEHASLKNIFQQHGVPPWERQVFPMIYAGTQLVCVTGLATAHAFKAKPDEEGVVVSWQKNPL